jgi:phospholipid-binding lipoprotein MlaA
LHRSEKGWSGTTSALLLFVGLAFGLTGCGTFSGLLKSDGAKGTMTASAPDTATTTETKPAAPTDDSSQDAAAARSTAAPDTTVAAAPQVEAPPLEARPNDDEDSGLAQRAGDSDMEVEDYDPWEPFNEKMFTFNRNLDKYLLKPAARGYRVVMPEPWQVLIGNGFSNINFLPRFVNSLLQAKWGGAGRELARFLINSTAGIGGVFDPAKDYWGIEKSREDFGQTLAVWGAPSGPYLILPFFEPMTVRDGIGKAVDGAMSPLNYVLPFIWDRLGMKAGDVLNDRALNYDLFQGFEESVVDMYSAVRHGYLQRRQQLIKE